MIVLNTNGKFEYSSFCTKGKSEEAERWLENYKDFIYQHRENVIMEFDLAQKTANIHLATIPSERKDINGSPCDTSLTTIGAKFDESDYNIMTSLIKYALSEGFDSLGGIFDSYFKEDFFNVKNQEDIQSADKEELVNYKLKDLYEKHTKLSSTDKHLDLPKVEKDDCIAKSVKTVDSAEFASAMRTAQDDTEADKYILLITRLTVSDEKVAKFAFNEDSKFAKAMIFRTAATEETDWTPFVIKKKTLSLPTKVGLATVIIGIAIASLMIWLEPSKPLVIPSTTLDTSSSAQVSDSLIGCPTRTSNNFLSTGTYTDGTLKLRISDTLLQMFNANDSLIQSFIFRLDSVRKIDE